MAINWSKLREELDQSRAEHHGRDLLPAGEYVGRLVEQEPHKDLWGRSGTKITLEVTEGSHAGHRIVAHVYGAAEAFLQSRAARQDRLCFDVYIRRLDDGRAYSNLNVETVRLAPDAAEPEADEPVDVPTAASVRLAAADFTVGFACTDSIAAKRELVSWHEHFAHMAAYAAPGTFGRCEFGSTYCFTEALVEHVAKNNARDDAAGVSCRHSLAGFAGPAYAPLLTIDVDGYDTPDTDGLVQAHRETVALVTSLLELGVPIDLLLLFFSGSKGFHVQVPSTLAGALPSAHFAAIAGEFCRRIAGQCGTRIDEKMYRTLQPLRAPNSRNEKSGLFKVRLAWNELRELSIDEIKKLAGAPRPFAVPTFEHEPLPSLAAVWSRLGRLVAAQASQKLTPVIEPDDRDGKLFRSTWDFLINGASEGSRATELFKAAANLLDFGSVDALARALLQRPARISGLSPAEAGSHIDGAVRRAAGG